MASSCDGALASEVRELEGAELQELEPAISSRATHGIFLPNVRTVTNPLRLTQAILAAFAQAGGRIRREEVKAFERDGEKVSAVVQLLRVATLAISL